MLGGERRTHIAKQLKSAFFASENSRRDLLIKVAVSARKCGVVDEAVKREQNRRFTSNDLQVLNEVRFASKGLQYPGREIFLIAGTRPASTCDIRERILP